MPAAPRLPLALATLLLSGAVHAGLPADVITVGPEGPENDCSAATIQEAIAIANADPSRRKIWVRGSFGATDYYDANTAIVIDTDQDLEIVGGFPALAEAGRACSAPNPTGRTAISGSGGAPDPVFRIQGSGTVTLRNLDITLGDADDNEGGGIAYRGSGNLSVWRSVIHANEARGTGSGGGISFRSTRAPGTGNSRLQLYFTDVYANTSQFGGGVFVSGHARLEMERATIDENTARASGGGVYFQGPEQQSLSSMGLDEHVSLSNNRALGAGGTDGDGGAVYFSNGSLDWSGPDGQMWFNSAAKRGGAMFVTGNASAHIKTRGRLDPASGQYQAAIYANTAWRGGGIAAVASREDLPVKIQLSSHDGQAAQVLSGNSAEDRGGALYMKAHSSSGVLNAISVACMSDVRFSSNSAPRGAVVYSERGGGVGNVFAIHDPLGPVSELAPYCRNLSNPPRVSCTTTSGVNCNLIDSNISSPGRVLEMEGAPGSHLSLYRTRFYNNQAQQLIFNSGGGAITLIRNVFDQNRLSSHLLLLNDSVLRVEQNTIADNDIGEPTMLRADSVHSDSFSFSYNVVAQPDRQTLLVNGAAQPRFGAIRSNLSNDANLNAIDRSNLTAAPIFNHGNGAYALDRTSPGLDSFASADPLPLDFSARSPVDLPQVPNPLPGAIYDIGAWELQSGASPPPTDPIFLNSFE